MPLTHVNCASPKYRNASMKVEVALDDCLACAASRENDCQFTYELLSSMFAQNAPRDYISTTVLTQKCLRSTFLERQRDFAEDPEKLWPAFRGTLYHGQLEQYANFKTSIEEPRYHVELPEGHLSGSPDLLDVEKGILFDYKTTKEVPRFDRPWSEHVAQMNVNRWLVDHASYVEYRYERYDLSIEENRKRFVPKEWTRLVVVYIDDKGPKPLDCTKSVQVPKKTGKGTKAQRVPDIWDDEYAEEWIRTRYVAAQEALVGNQLPAIPEEFVGWNHPLCGWCPSKKECIELEFGVPVELRRKS